MSLFSWFSRKPSPSKPRSPIEPSGLLNADATVPLAVGRNPALEPRPVEHAANRKNERMERRELLYSVVRDAMVKAAKNVLDKYAPEFKIVSAVNRPTAMTRDVYDVSPVIDHAGTVTGDLLAQRLDRESRAGHRHHVLDSAQGVTCGVGVNGGQ